MSPKERVAEARQAVLRAADSYAIAEGSGGDTSDAVANLAAELDDFADAVRMEVESES